MALQIYNTPQFTPIQISVFERELKARYICDTSIWLDDNWVNLKFSLFYSSETNEKGSNWIVARMGEDNELAFYDGIGAVEPDPIITAVRTPDGYMYSTHRHDMVCYKSADESRICIDGGRDYLKLNGDINKFSTVKLAITESGLVMVH